MKLIFLDVLRCPCTLRFYLMRHNKNVANTYVAYAKCNRYNIQRQKFKCEIENLDSAVVNVNVRSGRELV